MADDAVFLSLDPALTSSLHRVLPSERSPLFPFPASGSSSNAESELRNAGILDGNNRLCPAAERLFGNLVRATAKARVRVMADGELLEFHVFMAGDRAAESTSFHPLDGVWRFDTPASIAGLKGSLEDMMGNSRLCGLPSLGRLSRGESLVLGACIDQTRGELLEAMGRDQPWKPSGSTVEAIVARLQQKKHHPSSLLWLLDGLDTAEDGVAASEIGVALDALRTRGWVEPCGNGFAVSGEALYLAGRFLLLQVFLRVDFSSISGGGVRRSSMGVVQNGVRDLLLIEPGPDAWHWAGVSARVLFELLGRYLTDPRILDGSGAEEQGSCGACEKPIEQGDSFCKFCGSPQKVSSHSGKEPAKWCSKCGAERKPGKKFCPKCGAKA